jgi:pSer/pThr/pTyr-binding forkhead associated (FHA) protein
VTVEDVNSTNKTRVNDRILEPNQPAPLVAGDRLKFGGVEFAVRAPEKQA